jgi:hypothetical protein
MRSYGKRPWWQTPATDGQGHSDHDQIADRNAMSKEVTMRYQAFVRAAAGVLSTALLAAGAAVAQTKQPEPATMTDVAPLPATERESLGAVILMDEPVLAQREALQQAQERSGVDTRALGAGPARLLRNNDLKEAIELQRALDEWERQKNRATPQ